MVWFIVEPLRLFFGYVGNPIYISLSLSLSVHTHTHTQTHMQEKVPQLTGFWLLCC